MHCYRSMLRRNRSSWQLWICASLGPNSHWLDLNGICRTSAILQYNSKFKVSHLAKTRHYLQRCWVLISLSLVVFSYPSCRNPFTAPGGKISRLNDARTCLQTVYFPILQHLFLKLCALMEILSHTSAKKTTKRLKRFKFHTLTGCFQATSWQWWG